MKTKIISLVSSAINAGLLLAHVLRRSDDWLTATFTSNKASRLRCEKLITWTHRSPAADCFRNLNTSSTIRRIPKKPQTSTELFYTLPDINNKRRRPGGTCVRRWAAFGRRRCSNEARYSTAHKARTRRCAAPGTCRIILVTGWNKVIDWLSSVGLFAGFFAIAETI